MTTKIRIGSVTYLNARPLVYGLERGMGAERIELSHDVPSTLADRMAAGELDIALLPSFELARIPDLEITPGLGIVTRGAARSVFLAAKMPLDRIRRVALDPHSRTSNALVQVLFAEVWDAGARPAFVPGPLDLEEALADHHAAVRIGDKALFEPIPEGVDVHDLGSAWTERTGLPFVFAVWAARPGVLDQEIYRILHASRREGSRMRDRIADDYTWHGAQYPAALREYLREHIQYRLGAAELQALRTFFEACARIGLIERPPELRLGLKRWTMCDETAAAMRATGRTAVDALGTVPFSATEAPESAEAPTSTHEPEGG